MPTVIAGVSVVILIIAGAILTGGLLIIVILGGLIAYMINKIYLKIISLLKQIFFSKKN